MLDSQGGDGNNNRGVRHGETVTVTARAPDHRGDVYGGESRSDVGVKTGRDPDVPPDNIDVAPVIVITGTPIPDYEDFFGADRNWFTDYLYNSYRHAAAADLEYTIWKVLQSIPDGGPAISVSVKLAPMLVVTKELADTKSIRFTQDSIGSKFKDRRSVQGLIDDLKSGKVSPNDLPAIRTFQKDGLTFTLDNRRLFAAHQAGVKVKTVPATAAEIAKELPSKFTTPNQGAIIGIRGKLE